MASVQPTNKPVPSDHPADARDNFKRIDEFVSLQSTKTSPTRVGKELVTIFGIGELAENQRDQFNSTFTAQFQFSRVGNISDFVGDSLPESDKLNSYQYPDDSGNWYGPIQSQTFPITIPANPSSSDQWALVNSLTSDSLGLYSIRNYKASSANSGVANMIAGIPIQAKSGETCKVNNTSFRCLVDNPSSISDFTAIGEVESSAFFKESPTPSERMQGLVDALSASDNVIVSAGVYDQFTLSGSNKKLTFEKGHEFKLPDGSSSSSEVEALRVFEVTGSNCELVNELVINGNLSNNSADSISTSDRRGAFHNASTGLKFERVTVNDANWVGFSQGSIADSSMQTDGGTVKIINPRGYATSDWDATGGINRIEVIAGADSLDARVRTGSQNSTPSKQSKTTIGQVISNYTVVIEANSNEVIMGLVTAQSMKMEDCQDCHLGIGTFSGVSVDAYSFAMLSNTGCSFGSVSVSGHNGASAGACFFSDVENSNNGVLSVIGSMKGIADVTIRGHKNLTFDHISTPSGNASDRGVLVDYDASYQPQEGLVIGSINSMGHSVLDVELQNNGVVRAEVGHLNHNATTNVAALLNKSEYDESTFPCELKSGSGTITLNGSFNDLSFTKIGRAVSVTGRLRVSSVSSPSGVLTLEFLPSPAGTLPDMGGLSSFTVSASNTDTTWEGIIIAQTGEGTNVLTFSGVNGSSSFDVADKMQAGTNLDFMFTYFE